MLESTLDVEIVLPVEAIALIPIVKAFQDANRYKTAHNTEWFLLCSSIKSLVNWNNRAFNDDRLNNLEFSASVARAYSGLFQLSKQDIPHCLPSDVAKAAVLTKELIVLLSNINPLPDKAKSPVFHEGLMAVSQRRPSDIPAGASGHGNPIVRWLINMIAEEFCYSFDREPTVSIIGDLARLGWPKLSNRSIRNTFTDELSSQALKTAQIRRENDNKSKVIAQQVISALPSRSKGIATNQPIKGLSAPSGENDNHIQFVTEFLNKPDSAEKRRFISLIEAMQYDEQNYLADNGN
ncbi:MAG: hypothetical protein ACXW1W_13375 [Methylococcaceae bacterium]